MEVTIKSEVDQIKWNQALEEPEYGTIYQTTYFADYVREILKEQPIFITAKENGKIFGQLLLFKTCCFHGGVYDKPLGSLMVKFFMKIKPLYHWYFGPVTHCTEEGYEAYTKILYTVRMMAKGKGINIFSCYPASLRRQK